MQSKEGRVAIAGIAIGTVILGAGIVGILMAFNGVSELYLSNNLGAEQQNLHLKGKLDVLLYDGFGTLKDERHFDNMIVDAGFEGVAYRIAPHGGTITPSSPYNYIAIGTGSTPAAAAQTALVSELIRLQDSQASYSTSSKQLTLQVVFAEGEGTGTITESGLFNAASDGDMLARQTFSQILKGANDTLTVTWTITLATA